MKKAIILDMTGFVAQWRDYGDDPSKYPPADFGTTEISLADDFQFPTVDTWYINGQFTEIAPFDQRALVDNLSKFVTQWRDYMMFTYPPLNNEQSEVQLPKGFQIPTVPTWYVDGNFTQIEPPPPALPPMTAEQAKARRDVLLAEANFRIAPLQDAVDIGEATVEEEALLKKWKKYRVDLSRIETQSGFPANVQWPVVPA